MHTTKHQVWEKNMQTSKHTGAHVHSGWTLKVGGPFLRGPRIIRHRRALGKREKLWLLLSLLHPWMTCTRSNSTSLLTHRLNIRTNHEGLPPLPNSKLGRRVDHHLLHMWYCSRELPLSAHQHLWFPNSNWDTKTHGSGSIGGWVLDCSMNTNQEAVVLVENVLSSVTSKSNWLMRKRLQIRESAHQWSIMLAPAQCLTHGLMRKTRWIHKKLRERERWWWWWWWWSAPEIPLQPLQTWIRQEYLEWWTCTFHENFHGLRVHQERKDTNYTIATVVQEPRDYRFRFKSCCENKLLAVIATKKAIGIVLHPQRKTPSYPHSCVGLQNKEGRETSTHNTLPASLACLNLLSVHCG